jgi:hypothetical protein
MDRLPNMAATGGAGEGAIGRLTPAL